MNNDKERTNQFGVVLFEREAVWITGIPGADLKISKRAALWFAAHIVARADKGGDEFSHILREVRAQVGDKR